MPCAGLEEGWVRPLPRVINLHALQSARTCPSVVLLPRGAEKGSLDYSPGHPWACGR